MNTFPGCQVIEGGNFVGHKHFSIVCRTKISKHISRNDPLWISNIFSCSSYFIVISTIGNQPEAPDIQDSLVEDTGLYEENHMQLVPVNYFMDNRADDSGNFTFSFLLRSLFMSISRLVAFRFITYFTTILGRGFKIPSRMGSPFRMSDLKFGDCLSYKITYFHAIRVNLYLGWMLTKISIGWTWSWCCIKV